MFDQASGDMLMCRTTETVTARIEELEQSNVKLRDMANTTTQQLTRLEKVIHCIIFFS